MGIILFIAGFMGAVYSIPLSDNITISGGNLAYGAFMMTTVLLVILERDINVIRTVVRMVIMVSILKFIMFTSLAWTLNNDDILNLFNTSSDVFSIAVGLMLLGGSLTIVELLLFVFIFEGIKTQITNIFALSILYVLCFMMVLCLDGIAFPLVAFMFDPELVDIIIGGMGGKLVMAVAYGFSMLLFLVVFRKKLTRFVQEPLVLRELLHFSRTELIQTTHERDTLYRSLVDLSPDTIIVYDEAKLLYINKAGAREFGQSLNQDEMIGKDIALLLHPKSRATSAEIIKQLMSESTQRRRDEMEIFLPDGQLVYIEVSSAPIEFHGKAARQAVIRNITEHKVTKQRLRFQADLLNAVQQAVIATDNEGIVTYWNEYATELYGWTNAEALGQNISTLMVPNIAESQATKIMNQLRQGLRWSGEMTMRRKDSGLFPAMVTISPINNVKGELEGMIGLSQDITKRKQLEMELQTNHERLKMSQRIGQVGSWEYDLGTGDIWGSEEGFRIYGLEPALEGILPIDQIEAHIPERERVHQALIDLINEGKPYDLEFVIEPLGSQKQLVIHSVAELIRNDAGIPIKVSGVIQDVTERAQATSELSRNKMLLESIFLSLGEAVLVVDHKDRTIIMCNPIVETIFGYTPDEVIGKNTEFLHISREAYVEFVKRSELILEREGIFRTEYQMKRQDGQLITTENTVTLLDSHSGLLGGAVSVVRDITERRQAELELFESEERYRQVFKNSPATIWVQDFSQMKRYLDSLVNSDCNDLQAYLEKHPQAIDECVSLAVTINANQAAVDLYGASNEQEVLNSLGNIVQVDHHDARNTQLQSLIAIATGQTLFEGEFVNRTMRGDLVNVIIRWSVIPGYENSYERVLVTGLDITRRKKAEADLKTTLDQERTIRYQAEVLRITAEIMVRTTLIEVSLQQAAAKFKEIIVYDILLTHVVEQRSLQKIVSLGAS